MAVLRMPSKICNITFIYGGIAEIPASYRKPGLDVVDNMIVDLILEHIHSSCNFVKAQTTACPSD